MGAGGARGGVRPRGVRYDGVIARDYRISWGTSFGGMEGSHEQACTWFCAIALISIPAFPSSSVAQGKSLKDQLVGTWIYVSSTGKREDGSAVQRPSLQGAVTYTADGRFHFITVRTDVPKYASGDPARGSHGRCVGRGCLHRDLHAGRKHEDGSPQ